jgi:hypothetical protein
VIGAGPDVVELDGEWSFIPDSERLHEPTSLPDGLPITVPGVWEAQVERPWRIVVGWYKRRFQIPAEWDGDCVLIRFGAVMYSCEVWLNGQPVGEHEGGYTRFSLDATAAARPGSENELIVRVVNPLNAISQYPALAVDKVLLHEELEPDLPLSQAPHGKQTWYSSMSGIWKSVHLERVAPTWISSVRVIPDVPGEAVNVRWRVRGADVAAGSTLHISILDPAGEPVAKVAQRLAADETEGEQRLAVRDPILWDIEQPNLYRAVLRFSDPDDGQEHRLSARFGMREIRTEGGQILLNGRPIYMLGALDQDLYPDTIATPPSREMLDDQLRKARELGFNLLRCHIKVPDAAYVEAADEAGMLLWLELPNWSVFTPEAAARGRQTLEEMVEEFGNNPSVVIWTIINEDWGTNLRYEAGERLWLRQMVEWLRDLDPTRLIVDNSACETPRTPNFHVDTDLADFHIYFGMPDNARRWRSAIDEFARRPAWLWSPNGDAVPSGDEPLVLSEFGNWGLPRLDRLFDHYGRDPWWFGTGESYYLPRGVVRRFGAQRLDRLWDDVDALAEATQWHQFEALQYEIGQLRRHDSIQGYVVTELTDAYWEANGVLDIARGEKAFHDRLGRVNAPDVVIADLPRRDLWGGGRLEGEILVSSFGEPSDGGKVEWTLRLADGPVDRGELPLDGWPRFGVRPVAAIDIPVPDVDRPTDATLELVCRDGSEAARAADEIRLAVLPESARRSQKPLAVTVHDPLDIWSLRERISSLGHRLVAADEADVVVAAQLNDDILRRAENGASVVVLVRTRDALPDSTDIGRRLSVHLRHLPHGGWPGQRSPWEGDWINSFSWLLPGALPGLPDRRLLDFSFEQVMPDHVLLNYDPQRHADEVSAGMFVGWIHAPAALLWSFPQGAGQLTITTFHLSPEAGPVATAMLEGLLQQAAVAGPARRQRQETAA